MKTIACAALLALTLPAFAGTACPAAADAHQADLLGPWLVDFDGGPAATLVLTKHPEDEESFRGTVDRRGAKSELAGDIDHGQFSLEESADGTHISGTWQGAVVDGSCAREIRGTWTAEGDEAHPHPFLLHRR